MCSRHSREEVPRFITLMYIERSNLAIERRNRPQDRTLAPRSSTVRSPNRATTPDGDGGGNITIPILLCLDPPRRFLRFRKRPESAWAARREMIRSRATFAESRRQ